MDLVCRAGPELGATELYELLRLRTSVFVVEQHCPYQELDGRDLDEGTVHLWVADGHGVAATVRILDELHGVRRIGRVVTRADRRGEGWSSHLVSVAIETTGDSTIVLDAQSHLRAFYERLGFAVVGPAYLEDGIPHLPMERTGPGGASRAVTI
jgi:ElaA protein